MTQVTISDPLSGNMKALSAHRKGKKCMDLRVLSDETTSHKDPNEENVSQITPQNE